MRICLILFPGFSLTAFSLVQDMSKAVNEVAGQTLVACDVRSITGGQVGSSTGVFVSPDRRDWSHSKGLDMVALIAGSSSPETLPMGLRRFVAEADVQGATLAGIGFGALALARLGRLKHYRASVPDGVSTSSATQGIALSNQPFVLDRTRLSARTDLVVPDAMAAWLSVHLSPDLSQQAYGVMRSQATPAPSAPKDQMLDRMTALMTAHLATPLSLPQIADTLAVSTKQLRTRCQSVLGRNPTQVYLTIRLEAAKRLIMQTGCSVDLVAAATGFSSASAFTRSFKRQFGATPRALRHPPVSPTRSAA